jgi:hypothetical protein
VVPADSGSTTWSGDVAGVEEVAGTSDHAIVEILLTLEREGEIVGEGKRAA